MKRLVAAAIVVMVLVPVGASGQETKEGKVRELLTLMRVSDMSVQMLDGMMAAMRGAMPQVNEEFWTAFRAEVKTDEFINLLVPIYASNFEEADLDGLIQFYRSPVGKRLVEKQPLILQQSMAVGQKWGEQLAERAMQQLNKQK